MPKDEIREEIRIDYSSKTAKIGVWVLSFKDDGHHIAYIPSLNLTAYGATEEEANDMLLNDVLGDYLDTLLHTPESEVTKELSKYGWKRSWYFKKKFYNTPYIDEEGVLKNFNLPNETPVKREFIDA